MNKVNVLEVKFDYNGEINTIYPVILIDNEEMILVDCGYPNFLQLIKETAKNQGIDMSKLTKIIITHHDYDHMGAVAEFKREYPNIKILASYDDEKYISGREKSLRLQQAESIYDTIPDEQKPYAMDFQNLLESIESVNVDICLKDKDYLNYCGGIEIISTPGHMPGHISIYLKESNTLIAGDALVIENGVLEIANPQYTLDMDKAKESIKKLLNYNIDRIICYHGGIYNKEIKESLQKI